MVVAFTHCQEPTEDLPAVNFENGGLFLPKNFEAIVAVDSLGPTRHITVNDNGDIYAQLQRAEDGKRHNWAEGHGWRSPSG